jgi:hypothetical protein
MSLDEDRSLDAMLVHEQTGRGTTNCFRPVTQSQCLIYSPCTLYYPCAILNIFNLSLIIYSRLRNRRKCPIPTNLEHNPGSNGLKKNCLLEKRLMKPRRDENFKRSAPEHTCRTEVALVVQREGQNAPALLQIRLADLEVGNLRNLLHGSSLTTRKF